MTFLRENYTGTTWFPHIVAVKKMSGSFWVTTDLPESGQEIAAGICRGVSAYALSNGGFPDQGIRIGAATGQRLVWRHNLGGSCD